MVYAVEFDGSRVEEYSDESRVGGPSLGTMVTAAATRS